MLDILCSNDNIYPHAIRCVFYGVDLLITMDYLEVVYSLREFAVVFVFVLRAFACSSTVECMSYIFAYFHASVSVSRSGPITSACM